MNWTGTFSSFFIKNGKLTLLIFISLFVWGIISFVLSTKKYNPTIVAPAFQIMVDYPGASRKEVLEQVTKPLENILTDISGVEDIYSVTTRGGRSVINVNFYVGEDFNEAKISINDRIQSDMKLAPLGIPEPIITTIDPDNVPVTVISLSSQKLDPIALRKYAFILRDQLSRVEGTSRIFVVGGRRKELSVTIDSKKLATYALGINDIAQALKSNNLYLPSGLIKGPNVYTPLEVIGWVQNPEDVKNIVVATKDVKKIQIKDIATVSERTEEVEQYVRHLTKSSTPKDNVVLISVAKLKGSNITEVTDSIKEKLNEMQIGDAVSAKIIINNGDTARDEINGLLKNLLTAILIVTIVLFFFLNFKSALLVAIAIPLTLFTVFGVAHFAGQDINRITLFALILSLGLLVDNATVVIENIARNVSNVKNFTKKTFIDSVNEVGPGLFMSTITTVIAFIPMAFISGMMGPYMGPIPFFVPAAIIISLFISFSINPWMASVIIRKSSVRTKEPGKLKEFGEKILNFYRKKLKKILVSRKKRNITLISILTLLLVSMALPALYLVKFRMLPKANVNQFFVYVDLPAGSSLEETYKVTLELEKELLTYQEVNMAQSYIGVGPITDFNGLFKNVESRRGFNQATIRVGLIDDEKRELTSEELVLNWRLKLNKLMGTVSPNRKVKLKLIEDPPGPPVLSTLLVKVQSNDNELLREVALDVMPQIKKIDGVVDIDMSLPEKTKTFQFIIDTAECARTRITPAQIVTNLNAMYSGKIIGIYHHKENIEQELIRLRFHKKARLNLKSIEDITFRNPFRISIPLSRLAKIKEVETSPPLLRENHRNTIYISGEMSDRSITYAGIDLLKSFFGYKLHDQKGTRTGFDLFGVDYKSSNGENVRISLGGEWELTLEVFRDLILAMLVAVFIIYVVLVAQFMSFMDALIIMSTIPLSIIGVFPGFMALNFIMGEYFTATSMIGIIALAGIAVNNSIILLEYLNSLRDKGNDLIDALVDACSTRLRPIALTTITTMLGSLTILDDPVWSGLAWAIILGLGMSSALILIAFPALYVVVRKKDWK